MTIKERLRRWSLPALYIGLLNCAAQAKAVENPVTWSMGAVPQKSISPGAAFAVKLIARIDPGWHLYAIEQEDGGPIATEISLADQSFLTLGAIHASKPIQLLDPNFQKRVGLYVKKAEFTLPLSVPSGAPEGSQHTAVRVRYQCCNETTCLPPRTAAVDLAVSIEAKR